MAIVVLEVSLIVVSAYKSIMTLSYKQTLNRGVSPEIFVRRVEVSRCPASGLK